jgi:general secretion pathway protein E
VLRIFTVFRYVLWPLEGVYVSQALEQFGDRNLTARDVLQALVNAGMVSRPDGENLMRSWVKSQDHPLNLLFSINIPDKQNPGKYFTQDEILTVLSHQWKINYQRVDIFKVRLETVGAILPHAYVDRLKIVPIEIDNDKVVFLTSEPFSVSWMEEVYPQLKRKIQVRLAGPKQIQHLLNEIYVVQKAFRAMAHEQGRSGNEKLRLLRQGRLDELDSLIEKSRQRKLGVQDGYITKIVDWLINYASLERASDIHLEPKKGMAQVRFRVDGDLRTVYRLDHDALLMIVSRFKILADLKLDEKRKPQDGGIKRRLDNGKQVEMRISTLPTNFGEKMVVRIFDKNVAGNDLSFIGDSCFYNFGRWISFLFIIKLEF